MKFTELTVLLPCHSLEDFPLYHEGTAADEILAAWCALWHPALVANAEAVPNWQRVDVPSETLGGRLITLPPFCLDRAPAGFVARAKNEGAWLVQQSSLDAVVAAACEGLEGGDAGVDAGLAADFIALGFCRLQIELLTRQMRYSTNIDEAHFNDQAVAAAKAAVSHDAQTAREHLAQCFDTLYEARKHYYPVDIYLLDLTLVAATTLAEPLRQELVEGTPTNLLAPTSLWQQMSNQEPASWSSLLAAIDRGAACVLGGESDELELPLLPIEMVRASLEAGVQQYEALLGRRPQVYARRRAGLWPALPQLLVKFAFQGALHFTLDDGRFPLAPQCKTRWEGLDSSAIDVFGRVPCDAAKSESFLGLARKLAESMDSDHVATLAFAHWPSACSPWYDCLRRIAKLSPVLGKFMLLDDYFSHTDMPGRLSKFEPDEYRTPYLKQAIARGQRDPISRFVAAHRRQANRSAARAISTLADLVGGKTVAGKTNAGKTDAMSERQAPHSPSPSMGEGRGEGEGATLQPPHPNPLPQGEREFEDQAERDIEALLDRFAAALSPGTTAASSGYLVVNPLSHARRFGLELPRLENPPLVAGSVVASGRVADRKFAVIDVPPLGFAWVASAGSPQAASRVKGVAHENVLRNEFFEATISRTTGGIQSVYSFQHRGNQLSQQIAFRMPAPEAAPGGAWRDPDSQAVYTTMRAESVEVTASCQALGEIVSRGALVGADGRRVAGFCQTTRVWAHSRLIHVEIELDNVAEPGADPWNSYYAARFAWPDDTAELWRGVAGARQKTDASRLEAPEYVQIASGSGALSILTGGLPYHRRAGERMLDSMLIVRGETARRFQLAIGVDLAQPAAAACEFVAPTTALFGSRATSAASGWLFHIDAKNVVATDWQPLVDERDSHEDRHHAPDASSPSTGEGRGEGESQAEGWRPEAPAEGNDSLRTPSECLPPPASGLSPSRPPHPDLLPRGEGEVPVKGFRARLLETSGRPGRVTLRAFRPVAAARQVDFLGQAMLELPVDNDKIVLDFAAHEWIEVEATWIR